MKKILLFFLMILLIPLAISVGVAPPSAQYIFEPGMEGEVQFYFRNNLKEPATLIASLSGELAEYAEIISEKEMYLNHNERGFVEIRFDLPESIGEPGWHSFNVIATEAEGTGGTVGARGQIVVPVKFFVQYPGKKLDLRLNAKDAGEGEEVKIELYISNIGTEKVSNAQANVGIYKEDEKIGEVSSETFAVDVLENKKIELRWDSEGASSGVYLARGTLDYEGDTALANDTFKLGLFDIEVLEHTQKVGEGIINRFLLVLESKWNREIENIFSEITVLDNRSAMTTFSIAEKALGPWEQKTLSGFLDAKDLAKGIYDLDIRLRFSSGGETREKTVKGQIEVVEEDKVEEITEALVEKPAGKIEKDIKGLGAYLTTTNILVALVIILIIVNIIILVKKKKKNEKGEGDTNT